MDTKEFGSETSRPALSRSMKNHKTRTGLKPRLKMRPLFAYLLICSMLLTTGHGRHVAPGTSSNLSAQKDGPVKKKHNCPECRDQRVTETPSSSGRTRSCGCPNEQILRKKHLKNCEYLRNLNLSWCNLTNIDRVAFKNSHIQYLNMKSNDIVSLPHNMFCNTNITHIVLANNPRFSMRPNQVFECADKIQFIDIRDTSFEYVPGIFSSFTGLEKINGAGLPTCKKMQVDLQHIEVWCDKDTQRTTVSSEGDVNRTSQTARTTGCGCPNEQILRMKHLKECDYLRSLDLSWCNLMNIAPDAFKNSRIRFLNMESNDIVSLPHNMFCNTNITHIVLANNPRFSMRPDQVFECADKIKFIDIRDTSFEYVPDIFSSFTNLENINGAGLPTCKKMQVDLQNIEVWCDEDTQRTTVSSEGDVNRTSQTASDEDTQNVPEIITVDELAYDSTTDTTSRNPDEIFTEGLPGKGHLSNTEFPYRKENISTVKIPLNATSSSNAPSGMVNTNVIQVNNTKSPRKVNRPNVRNIFKKTVVKDNFSTTEVPPTLFNNTTGFPPPSVVYSNNISSPINDSIIINNTSTFENGTNISNPTNNNAYIVTGVAIGGVVLVISIFIAVVFLYLYRRKVMRILFNRKQKKSIKNNKDEEEGEMMPLN